MRVEKIERSDDFGFGVGQQREGYVLIGGEPLDRGEPVVGDRRDAEAERVERIDFFIPGDRLVLAIRSPIIGSGKQDDQPAPPRQGFEIAVLAALIRRADRLRHHRADLRAPVERIETG